MGGMNDMLYGRMGRGFTDSASDLGRLKLTEHSDVDRGEGSSRVQDLSSRRDEAPEITPVTEGKAPEITPVTERGERDLERGDRVPDAERVANDLAQIIENMSEREAREAVADTVAAALQQKAEAKGEIIRDKDVQTLKESADGAVKDFERRNMSWFNKKKEGAKDTFRTLTWKKVLVGSLYLLRDVGIGGANSAVTMIAEHKFDGGLLGSSIGGSVFANRGLDAFGKFGGPIAQTAFGQGLNIGVLAGEGKFASNTSEAANTTHTNHTEYANMTRRANDDSLNLEDVWSNLNKKMGGDVDNAKTLLQNTGVITDID